MCKCDKFDTRSIDYTYTRTPVYSNLTKDCTDYVYQLTRVFIFSLITLKIMIVVFLQ